MSPQTPNPALDAVPPPLDYPLLPASAPADRQAALRLVADSIAQQHQVAARAIVMHPAPLAAFGLTLTLALVLLTSGDFSSSLLVFSGVAMAYLLAARYATHEYLTLAEAFRWREWAGERNEVVAARYGEDMIGVVVFRLDGGGEGRGEKTEIETETTTEATTPAATATTPMMGPTITADMTDMADHHKPAAHRPATAAAKCTITAWTVRLRYRGKGVGTDLLREAVALAKARLGPDVEVGFAADHANSRLLLPRMFNGKFRTREAHARQALQQVVEESEGP